MNEVLNHQMPSPPTLAIIETVLWASLLLVCSIVALCVTLDEPDEPDVSSDALVKGRAAVALRVTSVLCLLGIVAVVIGGCNAYRSGVDSMDSIYADVAEEITQEYKVKEVTPVTEDESPAALHQWLSTLGEDDWENRAQVHVLLDSGEVATYEIAFDEDDDLALYSVDNTQDNPENLRR